MSRAWVVCAVFVVGVASFGCGSGFAWGQAGSDWALVQRLDPGTAVRVASVRRRGLECEVVTVDDTQLVCSRTRTVFFVPVTRQIVFPRGQVRRVRLTKRVLSALAGGGIGVGIGVGVGFALQNGATAAEDPGLLPAILGLLGGVMGAGLGRGSDFLGGPVIYRAP